MPRNGTPTGVTRAMRACQRNFLLLCPRAFRWALYCGLYPKKLRWANTPTMGFTRMCCWPLLSRLLPPIAHQATGKFWCNCVPIGWLVAWNACGKKASLCSSCQPKAVSSPTRMLLTGFCHNNPRNASRRKGQRNLKTLCWSAPYRACPLNGPGKSYLFSR